MATFRTHYKTIEHFGLQMFLISYRYDCPESEMTVFNTFQRYQQCILAAILVQYSDKFMHSIVKFLIVLLHSLLLCFSTVLCEVNTIQCRA